MSALGSESWLDAGDYDEDHIQHTRVKEFVSKIDWQALRDVAQRKRDGIECKLSERYSRGHFNVVRKLEFADGVQWIARLRLPELVEEGQPELLGAQKTMEVEIATMAYLRKHTTIPVPEVFAHDLDATNEIGASYTIMSYIHGTSAAELAAAKNYDLDSDAKFWKRMAEIQIELACCTFDKIGCIYQDGGSFSIGPEVVTGSGPWNSPESFWQDLARHYYDVADKVCDQEMKDDPSFQLPHKFLELIKSYGKPDQKKFRLTNRDFGIHNVLVNEEFEIVGVIDFDGVMAAPIELVAQLPCLSGLDRPMPFWQELEKREPALARIKRAQPKLEKYVKELRKAAEDSNDTEQEVGEIVDWVLSDGASVVHGLRKYHSHQSFVNEAYWKVYNKLSAQEEKEF